MNWFILFSIAFLFSCGQHKSISRVDEVQKLKMYEINQSEKLLQAFFQDDMPLLENIFSEGVPVDLILNDGKTLLILAIENENFPMINFLLSQKADPNLIVLVEEKEYGPFIAADSIKDDLTRKGILGLLEGNIQEVNDILFFANLEAIMKGDSYDLGWLQILLDHPIDFKKLSNRDFIKYFVNFASKSTNSFELYKLVLNKGQDIDKSQWLEWVEWPFKNPRRYGRAKCKFLNQNQCFNFESFLNTCHPKSKRLFSRNRKRILPYLNLRNALIHCGKKYHELN